MFIGDSSGGTPSCRFGVSFLWYDMVMAIRVDLLKERYSKLSLDEIEKLIEEKEKKLNSEEVKKAEELNNSKPMTEQLIWTEASTLQTELSVLERLKYEKMDKTPEWTVTGVKVLDGYKLEITFVGGRRIYDAEELAKELMIEDMEKFRKVRVVDDTIGWPDDVSITPDYLYRESTPVK